jgi:hypothetical protein
MAEPGDPSPRYKVHASGAIAQTIRHIQRRAKRQGRGETVIAALTQIYQRLGQDPNNVGEPLYRLLALGLSVRTCVIRPLAVDFAVHEDKSLVFIKGVKLLTELA